MAVRACPFRTGRKRLRPCAIDFRLAFAFRLLRDHLLPACRRPRSRPPPAPPSGPRSMIQSAVLMTSRLCSTTSTVLPASTKSCSTFSSIWMSAKCKPGRRLVEQIQRAAGAAFDQLAGQLDALGLAAGKRRRRLAELEVIEAHVVQRLQLVADVGNVFEMGRALPARPFPALRRCSCP